MKVLASIFRLELQYLGTIHMKTVRHGRSRVFIKQNSSTATPEDPNTPRNIFELYEKNSHWLGVYDRHPLKKEPLTNEYIEEKRRKEKERLQDVDLASTIDPKNAVWTPTSKRVGAIGVNLGTTLMWNKYGWRIPCTLIQIKDCVVMDTHISREDGGIHPKTKLVIGALELNDDKKLASFTKEKMQWYIDRGTSPTQFWAGFDVTKDALLFPGTPILASHFVPGQEVVVSGITPWLGFQGVMKRWKMKGQPATHGQTLTHRKMGATGGGTDPGRIFPGKKMAGHMGGKWKMNNPTQVFRVDRKFNIVFVQGDVPSSKGNFVLLSDRYEYDKNGVQIYNFPKDEPPPFPTRFIDGEEGLDDDMCADNVCKPTDPSMEYIPFTI